MTEKSEKLEKVKIIIRSLLLSTPKGYTERQLATDYCDTSGQDIPYKFFGYSKLEDFLRSIPDVVHMRMVSSGGRTGYLLTGVANSSTQHLKQLVAKQKSTSGYANPFKEISKTGGRVRENYHYRAAPVNLSTCRSQRSMPSKPYAPVFVPPRFRTVRSFEQSQIKELISAYPKGLRLVNFERAYNQKYGIDFVPMAHGFRDLKECLSSISDIVQLVPDQDTFKLFPAGIMVEEDPQLQNISSNKDEGLVSEAFKIDLRRILSVFPNGIYLNQFPTEYERLVKKPLDCSRYGFHTVLEMVGDLRDVFYLHRASKHEDFLLFNAANPPVFSSLTGTHSQAVLPEPVNVSHKNTKSVAHIKSNIEKVLLAYPDGIRMDEFSEIYKGNCNEDLAWKDLGYKSLSDLFVALGRPIQLIPCKSGKVLLMHDSKAEHVKEISIPDCPVEPALPGTDYRYMAVADDLCSSGNYTPVFISQVNSPSELYFQMRGENTTEELEKLMTVLELYNSEEGKKYVIPENFLKLSMVCAALYPEDSNWHRGKITKFNSPNYVEIFFVDYGTKSSVHKKYLRFLRKDFMNLPAQAIKARLAFVKPIYNAWTTAAKNKILEVCSNIALMAKFTSITYKNTVSIVLCDVSGEEDIFMHSVLINQCLAHHSADDENELLSPVSQTFSENPSSLSPMGMTEFSYQAQLEYFKYMNYQYMVRLQAGMGSALSGMGQTSDGRGIDLKVVEKMNAKSVEPEKAVPNLAESLPLPVARPEAGLLSPVPRAEEVKDSDPTNKQQTGRDDVINSAYEETDSNQLRFSKVITINDYDIHLINYRGNPYMTSGDISLIIWGIDVLKKLLKLKNLRDESVTVAKDTARDLFDDLEKNNVKVLDDGESVHLFPLESVKEIMTTFHKNKSRILPELEKILDSFDPADSFWTTEVEEFTKEKTEESSSEQQLHKLSQKRLKLLTEMIQIPGNTDLIDKLKNIEDLIVQFKKKMSGETTITNVYEDHLPNERPLLSAVDSQKSNVSIAPGINTNTPRQVQSVRPTVIPRPPFVSQQHPLIPQLPLLMQYNPMAGGMYYYPVQQGPFVNPNIPNNPAVNLNYSNWSSSN